ncbi:ROK family protein [Flammeovirga aprica]|uniref:ROK family protein n=1 Tax=Flammeovirga aprica JL-4 TaxID=694437 RepID=A0A7X9XAV0_9BACT|nr:ROK family protein [Flammeovirga aprica]NME70061.1 ROK family protein [Flammeovirga aprica JL-4]
MKTEKEIIGVDLGGTNMRAGLVKNGEIIDLANGLVPKVEDPQIVIDILMDTIRKVMTPQVEGIGIGVPGLVESQTGVVYDIQNIPSWKEVPLKAILTEEFQVPVFVHNDASCFASGERYFGEGQHYDDFVGLITGTGCGSGIIKNGHLMQDQNCGAGEFGMIPYLHHNYEYYCSGQFFRREYNISGQKLAALAMEKDQKALEIFEEYGKHLAKVIMAILFSVDPKAIIIGGSVAHSYEYYQKAMHDEIKTFPYQFVLKKLVIKPSRMKEIAILGAAALYFNALNENTQVSELNY